MTTRDPLPPIQLLAAFEAAARLGSFKAAARELHVTPSAVSQQIKALEEALDLALFSRRTRAIALTEAGALYLGVARDTLETFRRGTALLLGRYRRRILRLSTEPAIVHDGLIPGLAAFQQEHRDVDLRLESSSEVVDLRLDAVDAALRFGRGPWRGVVARRIASVVATPVASAKLLARTRLRTAHDLGAHTLLRVQSAPDYWSQIAAGAGFTIRRVESFDSYLATLQAAAHGVGVALGLFPVSTAWVHDGRLVAPLPVRLEAGDYQLVCLPGHEGRAEMEAVRRWLADLFAALPPLAP
jgi:LysR family glycine cleavage system transcriptional activator